MHLFGGTCKNPLHWINISLLLWSLTKSDSHPLTMCERRNRNKFPPRCTQLIQGLPIESMLPSERRCSRVIVAPIRVTPSLVNPCCLVLPFHGTPLHGRRRQ